MANIREEKRYEFTYDGKKEVIEIKEREIMASYKELEPEDYKKGRKWPKDEDFQDIMKLNGITTYSIYDTIYPIFHKARSILRNMNSIKKIRVNYFFRKIVLKTYLTSWVGTLKEELVMEIEGGDLQLSYDKRYSPLMDTTSILVESLMYRVYLGKIDNKYIEPIFFSIVNYIMRLSKEKLADNYEIEIRL